MSVDCIVADDNPLLDFISIKNLNLNLNNKVSVNYLEVVGGDLPHTVKGNLELAGTRQYQR
jgi:hypothetical protein